MKLEVNGREVEVDDSFRSLSAADKERTVNEIAASFAGENAIGPESLPPPTAGELAARGIGSAAATAYGFSGDAISPRMAYDALGRPILEAAGSTFQKYVADPFRTGRAAAQGRMATPAIDVARQAIPEMGRQVSGMASTSPLTTSPITGSQYPSSVPDYRQIQKMAGPDIARRMSEAYAGNLYPDANRNDAVLRLLESDPEIKRLMSDPKFAAAVEGYTGKVPQGMSKLGRGLGLLGRTAARFAGPIGLASTAYDIYQAAPTAARLLQTGVAGRGGALGQTADEMGMISAPVEPDYIDDIRRRAAERALQ